MQGTYVYINLTSYLLLCENNDWTLLEAMAKVGGRCYSSPKMAESEKRQTLTQLTTLVTMTMIFPQPEPSSSSYLHKADISHRGGRSQDTCLGHFGSCSQKTCSVV